MKYAHQYFKLIHRPLYAIIIIKKISTLLCRNGRLRKIMPGVDELMRRLFWVGWGKLWQKSTRKGFQGTARLLIMHTAKQNKR